MHISLKKKPFSLATVAFALLFSLLGTAQSAGAVDAREVFDQLKTLDGTWTGSAAAEGEAAEAVSKEEAEAMEGQLIHKFQVSANGSVVMETMNPGTEHEMINMYHLDGDQLVITHYCAAGNQPTMKLDLATATATSWPFVFTGGTNLDPAKDVHIHHAKLVLVDADTLESDWTGYNAGEAAGTMRFSLKRSSE